MNIIYTLVCVFTIKVVVARIDISVNGATGTNTGGLRTSFSGSERRLVTGQDLRAFHMTDDNMKDAVDEYFGRRPQYVYLKSPTPEAYADLYKTYNWNEIHRELTIASVRLKGISREPVVVLRHDFNNASNKTIKVNTGISHTVENTVSTTWSESYENTYSWDINCGLNFHFIDFSTTIAYSTVSNWGRSEEKSQSTTIGTSTTLEMELKSGQAATAVLSATKGYLELEVEYQSKLRGALAVYYTSKYRNHWYWALDIADIMGRKGILDNIKTTETIKYGYYANANLKVYDKDTNVLLF